MHVPFNNPVLLPEHLSYLKESLATGHISGIGAFTKKCERVLEDRMGSPVRLVTSATHALELMAILLKIQPGDEVIVPSYTFVSTANAFALRGAKIVFADNDEFGNILVSEVERLKTQKTKCVVAVDYAGTSPDYDELISVCSDLGIHLVEDAAQGIGATYRGRPLGTLGEMGCFSFHETKNITSGEGGALVMRSAEHLERSEIVREKGTNRQKFFKGFVDKYSWVDIGSSFVLSDLNAAYLFPQLQDFRVIQERRQQIWENYFKELASPLERAGAKILATPSYNQPNYHMFAVVFSKPEQRSDFIASMKSYSIECPFHYVPLHSSQFGSSFYSGAPERLEGCEYISQRLVRFPLYFNLGEDQQSFVIEKAKLWAT